MTTMDHFDWTYDREDVFNLLLVGFAVAGLTAVLGFDARLGDVLVGAFGALMFDLHARWQEAVDLAEEAAHDREGL